MTKWGKEGRGESNVEGYVSVARVLDSRGREYAACFVPGPSTHGGITRKIERGAGASRTEALGPEMVAPRDGYTLVTAELDSRRRKCHTGSPEDMGKRNRGERGRESKKKGRLSSSGQTVESCSSDEGLGREDESKVRRTAATKPGALLLRLGHDSAPPGAASRGLRSGGRGASERSGGCLSRYSSEAECWEQAQLRGPTRVAVFSGSRGLADARPSGECRRRSDPEIPRSRGGVTGRRRMVSRTPSRSVARSGSVDNVIWSSGSGGEGRTGSSPAAPGSVETEPARGERAALRPRPALEERGRRRRRTPSRSAKRLGGATSRGISSGTTRPEEVRKARARESETSSRGRRSGSIGGVRGAEGLIGRGAPGRGTAAHSVNMGGPGAPMVIRAAGETRLKLKLDRAEPTWDDRPPDLGGMSLAEVGLALKSHLLAPRSESAASVENFVLRHSGLERGEDIERHSPLSALVLPHSG